jgi:hypothetical protein
MNNRTRALALIKLLQEEQEEFIFGLSNETDAPKIDTNNFFEIIRDKNTGRYYYTIDLDTYRRDEFKEICMYIYDEFLRFVIDGFENESLCSIASNLDHIYDVDSLTSAPTLKELFIRFMYVYKTFEDLW